MKKFRVKVEIRLKPDILDAEGRAIERAIRRLGAKVENTRKGKIIEFDIKGENKENVRVQVERIIKEFLINPLTEEYTFVVEEEGEKT